MNKSSPANSDTLTPLRFTTTLGSPASPQCYTTLPTYARTPYDLYVPLQHSCLLHPSIKICQTLSVPLQPFRVITSSLDHLLPLGGS